MTSREQGENRPLEMPTVTRIRWLLAEHLEGMRESPCKQIHYVIAGASRYHKVPCEVVGCPGYQPVPMTAEGLIDEGRLRRAIEAEGLAVAYLTGKECGWCIGLFPPFEHYSDLAIAFLKAGEEGKV